MSGPSIRRWERGSKEAAMKLVITHHSTIDLQEQVVGASEIPGSVIQDSFFPLVFRPEGLLIDLEEIVYTVLLIIRTIRK